MGQKVEKRNKAQSDSTKTQHRENIRKGGEAKRANAGERDHELEREGEPVEEHDTITFMPRLSSISI
jgi:hypothetical protein